MPEINEIIKREVNPFSLINLTPTNFWSDKHDSALMVESIHQEVIQKVQGLLAVVTQQHRSVTAVLMGDSGSGKSYLLSRLQGTLNSQAFFVYIMCNWADSGYIWRHILRATIDSLLQVPVGEQDSQLLLWLKSLSAFTHYKSQQQIWDVLRTDRQKFIKHLKTTYRDKSLQNTDLFFSILYDLTNPELYDLACEWLKGDSLSEESMQELRVRHCIDTEEAAKNILTNLGKISTHTKPIVLCFDNLDTMPTLNGLLDIQPLFNVNTSIHGDAWQNFLVIISVITNTWKRHGDRIQAADKARIDASIQLRCISLEQAKALWAYHLHTIHSKAAPKPQSSIFPLQDELLDKYFMGSKTNPRHTLLIGKQQYQKYKESLLKGGNHRPQSVEPQKLVIGGKGGSVTQTITIIPRTDPTNQKTPAEFKLLWQGEYKKQEQKLRKITLLSSPELVRMLQETLEALQLPSVKSKLISGSYTSYSLSYQEPQSKKKVGIVWAEDANMTSFYHVMRSSHKAIQEHLCEKLILIRICDVGNPYLKGNQIYSQIFNHTQHQHIKPSLQSVHYLATYRSLANSAVSHELFIEDQTIDLSRLQILIRESGILASCPLLQDLGIFPKKPVTNTNGNTHNYDVKPDFNAVNDFVKNLLTTQSFMGFNAIVSQVNNQFPNVQITDVQRVINLLDKQGKVKVVSPQDNTQEELICLVHSS